MRPRRAIRTLIVFLVLGAIATVVTSWAIHALQFWRMHQGSRLAYGWRVMEASEWPLVMTIPVTSVDAWDGYRVQPDGDDWTRAGVQKYGSPVGRLHAGWRICIQDFSVFVNRTQKPHRSQELLMVVDAGWPIPSLRCGTYCGRFFSHGWQIDDTRTSGISIHGGLQVLQWRRSQPSMFGKRTGNYDPLNRFALPLLPLWPGFLVNTAFYAILLFALARIPRMVRRVMRRRRGRCISCGYDRGGLETTAACPECGRNRSGCLPID